MCRLQSLLLFLSGTAMLGETQPLPQRNAAKPSDFFFIPEAPRPTVQAKSALPAGESPGDSGLALPEGLGLQPSSPVNKTSPEVFPRMCLSLWFTAVAFSFPGCRRKDAQFSLLLLLLLVTSQHSNKNPTQMSVVFESSAGLGRSNSQSAAFSLLSQSC